VTWGNRTDQALTGGSGSCYPFHALVDANNHFTPQDCSPSSTGYCYDAAGNLTKDNFHKYTYDAEGRIAQVDGGNTATYVYDGLGNRVEKTVGGADTEYLFDNDGHINSVFTNGAFANQFVYLNGRQLAEYSEGTTYFVHTDPLGSTRLLSKLDGTVRECDDYYPFGELIPCSGTSADRLKFTGKERDAETGLDYFGARYNASTIGRFMTPDPFNIITRATSREHFDTYLGQPQNWNLYAYTWNNPLRFTDPTGETVYVVTYTTGNQEGDEDLKKAAQSRANDIRNTKGFDPSKDTVLVAGVSSFKQFADAISQANGMEKQFGKVGEVDLFSHAGDKDGPNF
jgi:RHS repeat-associated protein